MSYRFQAVTFGSDLYYLGESKNVGYIVAIEANNIIDEHMGQIMTILRSEGFKNIAVKVTENTRINQICFRETTDPENQMIVDACIQCSQNFSQEMYNKNIRIIIMNSMSLT